MSFNTEFQQTSHKLQGLRNIHIAIKNCSYVPSTCFQLFNEPFITFTDISNSKTVNVIHWSGVTTRVERKDKSLCIFSVHYHLPCEISVQLELGLLNNRLNKGPTNRSTNHKYVYAITWVVFIVTFTYTQDQKYV